MKKLITLIIIIAFAVNSAGQGYALRPPATICSQDGKAPTLTDSTAHRYPPYARETLTALEGFDGDKKATVELLGIKMTVLFQRLRMIERVAQEIEDETVVERLKELGAELPYFTNETLQAMEASGGDRRVAAEALGMEIGPFHHRFRAIRIAASRAGDGVVLARLSEFKKPTYTEESLRALENAHGDRKAAARALAVESVELGLRLRRIAEVALELHDENTLVRLIELNVKLPGKLPRKTEETMKALEEAKGDRELTAETLGRNASYLYQRLVHIEKAAAAILYRLCRLRIHHPSYTRLPRYTEETLKALEEADGNRNTAAETLELRASSISKRLWHIAKIALRIEDAETLSRLRALGVRLVAIAKLPSYTEETLRALEKSGGKRKKAAGTLHITPEQTYRRLSQIAKIAIEIGDEDIMHRLRALNAEQPTAAHLPAHTEETLKVLEEAEGDRESTAETLRIDRVYLNHKLSEIRRAATATNNETILKRLQRFKPILPTYTEETLGAMEEAEGDKKATAEGLGVSVDVIRTRLRRIREIAVEAGERAILERLEKLKPGMLIYTEDTLTALEESEGGKKAASESLNISIADLYQRLAKITEAAVEAEDEIILKRVQRFYPRLPSYTEATLSAMEKFNGDRKTAMEVLKISYVFLGQRLRRIYNISLRINDQFTLSRLRKLSIGVPPYAKPPSHTKQTLETLEQHNGDRLAAAEALEISDSTMYGRLVRIEEAVTTILDRLYVLKTRLPRYTEETLRILEEHRDDRKTTLKLLGIGRAGLSLRLKEIEDAATIRGNRAILARLHRLNLPAYTEATLGALEASRGDRRVAADALSTTPSSLSQRLSLVKRAALEMQDDRTLARLRKLKVLPYLEETLSALEASRGDRRVAADVLGINSSSLFRRLRLIKNVASETQDKDILVRLNRSNLPAYTEETLSALEASRGDRRVAADALGITFSPLRHRLRRIREKAAESRDVATLKRLAQFDRSTGKILQEYIAVRRQIDSAA